MAATTHVKALGEKRARRLLAALALIAVLAPSAGQAAPWTYMTSNNVSYALGEWVYFEWEVNSGGEQWCSNLFRTANVTSIFTSVWNYWDGSDNHWGYSKQMTITGVWNYSAVWKSNTDAQLYYADGDWQSWPGNSTNGWKRWLTVTNLPWSVNCWVTNDAGPESMTVNWTRPAPYNVMVVRRLGAWPDPPSNGSTYTNKQVYGTDGRNRVIYAPGSGSSTMDRELQAGTASNYYYAFYTENYNYYSIMTGTVYAGRSMTTNTPAFRPNEHVDSFAYFLGQDLNVALAGGTNWSGNWTWLSGATAMGTNSLTPAVGYPSAWGNCFHLGPNITYWHAAYRNFLKPYSNGMLYFAFVYRPGAVGASKWSGMSIYDGATERGFVGAPGDFTAASLQRTGGGTATSVYQISTSGDNTLITKYDFNTHMWYLQAYYQTDTIPAAEPTVWGAGIDMLANHITNITRVAFNAGGWSGGDVLNAYYDEIRVATNWAELVDGDEDLVAPVPGPFATNILRNPGFETNGANWMEWASWGGMDSITSPAAEWGNYGVMFTNGMGAGWPSAGYYQMETVSVSSTYSIGVRARKEGTLDCGGVYLKWESWGGGAAPLLAAETNLVGVLTTGWQTYTKTFTTPAAGITSNKFMVLIVYSNTGSGSGRVMLDNAWLTASDSAFMKVAIGSTNYTYLYTNDTTNLVYDIPDGSLTNLATNPLKIRFGMLDYGSGLNRQNAGATNMNMDFQNWLTDNVTNYYETESSAYAGTYDIGASSTWRFTAVDMAAIALKTNRITVSAFDGDKDTANDSAVLTNQQVGYIQVSDDDVEEPVVANALKNWGFEIGTTGVNVQAPYWYSDTPYAGYSHGGAYGQWGVANATAWRSYSGSNEAYLCDWAPAGNDGGWWQEVTNSAGAGAVWEASGWFWCDSNYTSVYSGIKVQFYNGAGSEIGGGTNLFGLPGENWTRYTAIATSPANTVWARLAIVAGGQGQNGALQFDDVSLTPYPHLQVKIGSTYITPSDGTSNAYYYVDYSQVAAVSVANPLYLIVRAYDTDSGMERTNVAAINTMGLNFQNVTTNNMTNFVYTNSSPNASNRFSTCTNTWVWYGFSAASLQAMSNQWYNKISVNIIDADNDRANDRLSITNRQLGYLVVTSYVPGAGSLIIYDWFTNSAGNLNGGGGGTGWTGTWMCTADSEHQYSSGSFPTNRWSIHETAGHKALLVCTNGVQRYASRMFVTNFTTGVVYAAWIQNYQNKGDVGTLSAIAGIQFLTSATNETPFIGKVRLTNALGFRYCGVPDTNSSRTMDNGVGTDYFCVVRYNFSTRELCANAYSTNEMVAEEPQGYWDLSCILTAGCIPSIAGIRIKGGVEPIGQPNNAGNCYFDEIRAGTNWYQVTRLQGEGYWGEMVQGPWAQLIFLGTNYGLGSNNTCSITDAQLVNTGDKLDFAVWWTNAYGIFLTNADGTFNLGSRAGRVCPNWDPWSKAGGASNYLNMDTNFTVFYGTNGACSVTTAVLGAFNIMTSSVGDQYYITVSAENNNTNGGWLWAPNGKSNVPIRRAITINSNLSFSVTDDDTAYPTIRSSEKLGNEGLEGTNYWIVLNGGYTFINGESPHSGTSGATFVTDVPASTPWGNIWQSNAASPGNVYALDAWIRKESNTLSCGGIYLKLEFYNGAAFIYSNQYSWMPSGLSTTWQKYTFAATSPPLTTTCRASFGYDWGSNPIVHIYFDDLSLSESRPPLCIQAGGRQVDVTGNGWTNALYNLYDGDLASGNLCIAFRAYDADSEGDSGLARTNTTGTTATNMYISIDNLSANDQTNYTAAYSSLQATNYQSTSVWRWLTIGWPATTNMMLAGSNAVRATLRDADFDRAGDQLSVSNMLFGYLRVTDDDTNQPVLGNQFKPGSMLLNTSFEQPCRSLGNTNLPHGWVYDEYDRHGGNWGTFGWASWGHYPSDYGTNEAYFGGTWGRAVYNAGAWRQVTNELGAGSVWEASAWVWRDPNWTCRVWGLTIEFRDGSDALIGAHTSAFALTTASIWTSVSMTATSPAGAPYTRWVMWCEDVSTGGSLGIDEACLRPLTNVAMDFMIGRRSFYTYGYGSSAWFKVTDGDLASVNPSNNAMRWLFSVYDTTSGVFRSTDIAKTGVNYDIGPVNIGLQNIYTTYWAAWSSPDANTKSATATSAFRHVTNFTTSYSCPWETGQVNMLLNTGVWVTLSAPDNDFDWDYNDNTWIYDRGVGQAIVVDDDNEAPWPWGVIYLGANWAGTYSGVTNVSDADMNGQFDIVFGIWDKSGIWLTNSPSTWTNTDGNGGNVNVNIDLVNSVSQYAASNAIIPFTNLYAREGNGTYSMTVAVQNVQWMDYFKNTIGVWRIQVSCQDNDDDRGFHLITNSYTGYRTNVSFDRAVQSDYALGFNVYDDDDAAPSCTWMFINWTNPASTNVTDQQLHVGSWQVQMWMEDPSDVGTNYYLSGFPANYSLINPLGVTGVSQYGFDSIWTTDNYHYVFWRDWGGEFPYANIVTGIYSVVWSACDLDNDRTGDTCARTNWANVGPPSNRVLCIDDDTNFPSMPTAVVVSPTTWTNQNYFTVTFGRALDESGIFQYRTSTNVPTTVTDGVALASATITNTIVPTTTNWNFEIGGNGLGLPQHPITTNNWTHLGSVGGTCYWSGAIRQNGTSSMQHIISEGNRAGDQGKFTLCSQYLPLNNPSDQTFKVWFSAWFTGNMSQVQWSRTNVAFLKVECLDSNGATILQVDSDAYNPDPVNGSPLCGKNCTAWSNVILQVTNGPANTRTLLVSAGINSSGSALPATGYWDNLSITVRMFDTVSGGVIYTNAPEGSNRVYLFAVDDDDDRPADRLKSGNTNYLILLDTTTPVRVTNVVAVAGTNDDMSEIWIDWDRLYDGGGASLSPWQTYAIFYTTEARQPTNGDPCVIYTNGYANLSNITVSALLLTNMPLGEDIRVAVAGKDWAGNIGPLSTNIVSVSLSALYVTQGVLVASINGPQIAWTATNKSGVIVRNYDLIYCDALDFDQGLTSAWALIQSVSNSWAQDTGSATRTPPLQMVNTMRFYRAAAEGQWQTTRSPRVASAEIYGHKTLRFYRGQNWVGLPFVPDSNCVKSIFGYGLPGSNSAAYATRITWYSNAMSTNAKTQVWLSKSAGSTSWQYSIGGSGSADTMPLSLMQGFILEIPTNAAQPQVVPFIGRIPTNIMTGVVAGASAYNVLTFRSPRRLHPAQMNLTESGFKGGRFPLQSDRIWSLNRENQQSTLDCWLDTSGTPTWRLNQTPSFPAVPTNYFNPDDAVVIRTSPTNSNWAWTNKLLYPIPTRNMTP